MEWDTTYQNPQSAKHTTRSKKGWAIFVIVLVIIGASLIIPNVFTNNRQFPSVPVIRNPINISSPSPTVTPTPFPFQEMTIPYLRKREYTSGLGNLQQAAENSTYTSYLTNYDSDGLRINAQLAKPKGDVPAGGWKAVIFIHGYIPPAQYRTLENYASYVDYLARNGLVVFKIDLRGHAQSEGEPSGGYYSSDYIIDTLNAYAALQTVSFVHPKKIGLWGHSMAGNVVLRTVAAKPDVGAAVIWSGAVFTYADRLEYGINDNSYRPPPNDTQRQRKRREMIGIYGQFTPDSPFWRQVAPTQYFSDLKGAIQLHHAVNDDVVNISYSRNLNTLLEAAHVTHQLHEYQSGGHNISGSSFNLAMQRTVEFFKAHL